MKVTRFIGGMLVIGLVLGVSWGLKGEEKSVFELYEEYSKDGLTPEEMREINTKMATLEDFRKVAEGNEDFVSAGEAFLEEDYEKAVSLCQKVLQASPSKSLKFRTLYLLSLSELLLYFETGKENLIKEASQYANEVLELAWDLGLDEDILLQAEGEILEIKEKFEEVENQIKELRGKVENASLPVEERARAQYLLSFRYLCDRLDREKGIEELENLIENFPHTEWAERAKKQKERILALQGS